MIFLFLIINVLLNFSCKPKETFIRGGNDDHKNSKIHEIQKPVEDSCKKDSKGEEVEVSGAVEDSCKKDSKGEEVEVSGAVEDSCKKDSKGEDKLEGNTGLKEFKESIFGKKIYQEYERVKVSFSSLISSPLDGRISKSSMFISKDEKWLSNNGLKLKESDQVVSINAANSNLSGGGGIDGAHMAFTKGFMNFKINGKWDNLYLKDGSFSPNGTINSGDFAISYPYSNSSKYKKWYIIHGCGVSASEIPIKFDCLEKVYDSMKKMVIEMLCKASNLPEIDNKESIKVLVPAISTAIFAGSGKEKDGTLFSKEEFIKTIYVSLWDGVEEGSKDLLKRNSKAQIILNNWEVL